MLSVSQKGMEAKGLKEFQDVRRKIHPHLHSQDAEKGAADIFDKRLKYNLQDGKKGGK